MYPPTASWIDQQSALERYLAQQPADSPIGLDTEFIRRNTFYPQLALLQLSCDGHHALVDPLELNLNTSLCTRLGQHGAVVVIHGASEDMETLMPCLPEGPDTLFDTQLAASFVGLGSGLSYRVLVAELTGVELDKSQTHSDWMQRPLTTAQRNYATLDVAYLDTLHRQLKQRLQQRGILAWHTEDCQRLKQRVCHRHDQAQPHARFRAVAAWPLSEQTLLRRILLWREQTARQLNKPRPWLLEDALVLRLVQQPPTSLAELNQRCRGQRALRMVQLTVLFEQLTRPLCTDELGATLPVPAPPGRAGTKQALDAMKQCINQRARQLNLPPGLLCPRKVLDLYLGTREWPEFLEGWRRDVLENDLSTLLPD